MFEISEGKTRFIPVVRSRKIAAAAAAGILLGFLIGRRAGNRYLEANAWKV